MEGDSSPLQRQDSKYVLQSLQKNINEQQRPQLDYVGRRTISRAGGKGRREVEIN